ncbi:MAG TPA: DUF6268 family outer membrane beta-barrel protein, partial [Opitutus sp.]|nr:DUF6268 family outer membrane beta-barrel protein [Opitutus sp.]
AGPAGSVAVHRSAFTAEGRRSLSSTDTLAYGFQLELHTLDADETTYVPAQLAEVAVRLGFSRKISPTWTASLALRPGLYGDFEAIDGKTFNVPLLLGASYAQSRDLIWLFGVRANVYSEHPVLPIVGVRWQFAPDWSVGLAFPRSGVRWRVSPDLTLDAGIGFQGGTYRITESIGTPSGIVGRLANTFVDYREIRVGVGAEFALTRRVSVRLDAGAFTDRRFDYFDRDYTLDGDGGFYGTVALQTTL